MSAPTYSIALTARHAAMLAASGIPPEHASARGYVSVDTKKRVRDLGVAAGGCSVPGLLVPQRAADGSVWGYQYRPDHPRLRNGKSVKYETPARQRNGIDVPPGVEQSLGDPSVPLWVTEGVKKADSAAVRGLACVALPGVWSWRGTNSKGGKVAVADWHDVALNDRRVVLAFDSDVTVKPAVHAALTELARYLQTKGAHVDYCHLPDVGDGKTGLDDYLVGHDVPSLWALVRPEPPPVVVTDKTEDEPPPAATPERDVTPRTLTEAHSVFRRWLGESYDLDALDIVLATAAVEQLDGDPVWLLVLSGSGNAKTETVIALAGAGAVVTSSIASEGALLSATSKQERAADATGGLLRVLGDHGLLVLKDMTTVLSMNRDMRATVLAALREVYDGQWTRNVGTDGGRSLSWRGRIVLVGAVTSAYDAAHAVIASMGDRFALVRVDSGTGRLDAGRQALRNVGSEVQMRAELAEVTAGVLAGIDLARASLSDTASDRLLNAADLVTLSRTAVERDGRGDLLYAHQPEAPTRFAKMLGQVVRGATTLGIFEANALRLALRVARDSMPPQRLRVLLDLADNPGSRTSEVTQRVQVPRSSIDRTLQELHLLGLATVTTVKDEPGWRYTLAETVNVDVVAVPEPEPSPEMSVEVHTDDDTNEHTSFECESGSTDISGEPANTGMPAKRPDFYAAFGQAADDGDLFSCPTCGTPTPPSRAGHRALCQACSVAEIAADRTTEIGDTA